MSTTEKSKASELLSHADRLHLREQLSVLGRDLKDLGRRISDSIRDSTDEARHRVSHYGDRVADNVRHNPLTSVLIALGLGALIGMLLRRRA